MALYDVTDGMRLMRALMGRELLLRTEKRCMSRKLQPSLLNTGDSSRLNGSKNFLVRTFL